MGYFRYASAIGVVARILVVVWPKFRGVPLPYAMRIEYVSFLREDRCQISAGPFKGFGLHLNTEGHIAGGPADT